MRTATRLVSTLALFALGLGAVDAAPAAAGGGGCHRDRQLGPTEATGTSVDLVDFCMSTSVLRVDPGTVVTFTNLDPAPHNVVGSGMFVDELQTGESAAFRFDDAGTFAYACTLHPGMVGAVVVGDGRRVAPATLPIVPVEVQPDLAPPTTLAALPLGATSPAATSTDDAGVPVVPLAATLAAVAGMAYVAGRRRRAGDPEVTRS